MHAGLGGARAVTSENEQRHAGGGKFAEVTVSNEAYATTRLTMAGAAILVIDTASTHFRVFGRFRPGVYS